MQVQASQQAKKKTAKTFSNTFKETKPKLFGKKLWKLTNTDEKHFLTPYFESDVAFPIKMFY